jgi:DNA-binding NtrC family response regulator
MCTLRLSDPAVSRRHAGFRLEDGGLVVTDLGSTNGTSVNGVRVREAVLQGGEAVRIGSTVLSVKRERATAFTAPEATSFGRALGASPAMRKLFAVLQGLAATEQPVLLEGEAGVGKELVAEELHARGRPSRPFVVVTCQALGPAEIGERLFGAEGVLVSPGGGSVFVDEIASLPLEAQASLVRFLERPPRDAPRVLFATRHDLDREVAAQRFREDLLDRLAVTRVEIPPLRDRHGDVALLARAFWDVLASADPDPARASEPLPADFLPRFESYRWPGNVHELSLAVAVRFNLGELGRWRTEALRAGDEDFLRAVVDRELPLSEARKIVVEEFERRYVGYMLARHGNTRDAAAASGVALRYFQLLRARSEE